MMLGFGVWVCVHVFLEHPSKVDDTLSLVLFIIDMMHSLHCVRTKVGRRPSYTGGRSKNPATIAREADDTSPLDITAVLYCTVLHW